MLQTEEEDTKCVVHERLNLTGSISCTQAAFDLLTQAQVHTDTYYVVEEKEGGRSRGRKRRRKEGRKERRRRERGWRGGGE